LLLLYLSHTTVHRWLLLLLGHTVIFSSHIHVHAMVTNHLLLVSILAIIVILLTIINWRHLTHHWSLLSHVLVALLKLLNLLGQFFDLEVLHLELPTEVAIVPTVTHDSIIWSQHLILLDLLSQSMALLSLIIDLIEQIDVLSHDLGVLFLVNHLFFTETFSQVVYVLLQVPSLLLVLKM
jgi:hypothetical protein